jgi:hypothetical protein
LPGQNGGGFFVPVVEKRQPAAGLARRDGHFAVEPAEHAHHRRRDARLVLVDQTREQQRDSFGHHSATVRLNAIRMNATRRREEKTPGAIL